MVNCLSRFKLVFWVLQLRETWHILEPFMGFPGGTVVKNAAASARGPRAQSLGQEEPLRGGPKMAKE